jgi:hypothetical protein
MEIEKAKQIIDLLRDHEIQIVDFLFMKDGSERFQSISFDSSFVNEGLLLNGFENPFDLESKLIIPDLNLHFLNFFSSKPSLQIICKNEFNKNFEKLFENFRNFDMNLFFEKSPRINFFLKFLEQNECDEVLIHDLCSEIFEYSAKMESNFFFENRPKSFFSKDYSCAKGFYYKNIFLDLEFPESKNLEENFFNFLNSLLILKEIIQNVCKNFGFKAIFCEPNCEADFLEKNSHNLEIFLKIVCEKNIRFKKLEVFLNQDSLYQNFYQIYENKIENGESTIY